MANMTNNTVLVYGQEDVLSPFHTYCCGCLEDEWIKVRKEPRCVVLTYQTKWNPNINEVAGWSKMFPLLYFVHYYNNNLSCYRGVSFMLNGKGIKHYHYSDTAQTWRYDDVARNTLYLGFRKRIGGEGGPSKHVLNGEIFWLGDGVGDTVMPSLEDINEILVNDLVRCNQREREALKP